MKIVASKETAEAITSCDERCIGYAVQRIFEPCQVDLIMQDRQELVVNGLHLRCWLAPGHTQGLTIYELVINGERTWFTGDLFEARHAHKWVDQSWTGAPDFDRVTYIESLKRLLSLPPPDHIMTGHGPAVIGLGKRVLEMLYTEALTKWR